MKTTIEISFLDKLAQLRANNCAELPTPELAVLTRATARLRRSGILERCLQKGETAPDFPFISGADTASSLYGLLETGPVVINFFRGFWCSYCTTELEAYVKVKTELEALGCTYLAISPQKLVDDETANHYQAIYDRQNEIARLFGLVYSLDDDEVKLFQSWGLQLDQVNECENWDLPLPATFIIGTDRTVGYQFVDVDFRARCCPDELVEEARQLLSN